MNGVLIPGHQGGEFGMRHPSAILHACFVDHVSKMRKRPVSVIEFGRWLSACGFQRSLVGGRATWDIV